MKIQNPKDFWHALTVHRFGLFLGAGSMGSAVHGPAYFRRPCFGGLLEFLAVLVLVEAFALARTEAIQLPFNTHDLVAAVALYVVALLRRHGPIRCPFLAATAALVVITILYRPKARALVLISAGCVATVT